MYAYNGKLPINKKYKLLMYATYMNLKIIILSKIRQAKRVHTL